MHQKPRGEQSRSPFPLGFLIPFAATPEWLPASMPPEQSPCLPCACWRFEPLHGGLTMPPGCLCLASTEAAPRPLSALSWAPWACPRESGLGLVCPPRPLLPGWHWPCRTRSCCYCFVLACHPHCVAWAAAQKCMSEQFLITFHFLPNFLSLLSIEILWAGYKMGWHRAVDGRPWIWF